jgi:hypothetical protein
MHPTCIPLTQTLTRERKTPPLGRRFGSVSEVPLQRFVPNGEIIVPVEAALDLAPQAGNQDHAYRPLSVPRTDVPKKSA